MSEETKLQSISLELDSMTYRGGKEGGKPYFLIHHVSQGIYCKCSFFKCTVLPFFGQTRSHFIPGLSSVEAAAINSILQLKYFLFFFLLFPSFLHPFPPSSGSQGQFPLTQNVTVVEGGTANLTCRVDQNDNTSLQWSNPAQQTLYFDDKKGKLFPELTLLHCFL